MSAILERSFKVLEHLVAHPEGKQLSALAADLGMPLSATHRLLTELVELGYLRQHPIYGQYMLSFRLVSMGLSYLSHSGIADAAQPVLDQLAESTGELVRLAVVDGKDLTFVAKAQGARSGLLYDPDMGLSVNLACSAAGHAWLSTLDDQEAAAMVMAQGFGAPEDFGPDAPRSVDAVLPFLHDARERGFALIQNVFAPGMGSVAAPIRVGKGSVIGVVTIAGPLLRFTEERMLGSGPALLRAASDLGLGSAASQFFRRSR